MCSMPACLPRTELSKGLVRLLTTATVRERFMRWSRHTAWRAQGRRGFSFPELLVVMGIISLLLSITIPVLQLARRQAQQAKCAANLQQQGVALENVHANYDGFYPLWDDNGGPTRYTWIDVLVQLQALGTHEGGYCPADLRPDGNNEARAQFYGLLYPGGGAAPGVDYSYGISVTQSAGGWRWQPRFSPSGDHLRREFRNHDQFPSQMVLAADASWTSIYNLSGDYLLTGNWSYPTQWDNTIAWLRHPALRANFLMKDGHVEALQYRPREPEPIDTVKHFIWYPGESKNINPDDEDPWDPGNGYPNVPPIDFAQQDRMGDVFPNDLIPLYYTSHQFWTYIRHK